MIARRSFFRFTAGAVAAPLVIRAGLLMPISTTPIDGIWVRRRGRRPLYMGVLGHGSGFDVFPDLRGAGAFAERIVPAADLIDEGRGFTVIEGWHAIRDGHEVIRCDDMSAITPGDFYRMRAELS